MREYAEKRKLFRMQMRVPCPLEFYVDCDEDKIHGIAQNLSGGGVLFWTEQALDPGNRLKIVINPSAGANQTLKAEARVLRCSRLSSDDRYAVACSFIEVD